MKKIISGILLTFVMSGCGALVLPSAFDDGHFLMMGDSRGIGAYSRGQVGMIDSGKNAPNTDSSYWVSDRLEKREKTKQALGPTLWQKLFGRPSAAPIESASR